MNIVTSVQKKIFTIRNKQVMLDSDLAKLYTVSTKRLNEQVKRNKERFPENFMFKLSEEEVYALRSHFATTNSKRGGRRALPYVFTEQGVAMLSTVIKSKTAVKVSISIMEAFVLMRKFLSTSSSVQDQIDNLKQEHISFKERTEENFKHVFDALQVKKPSQGIFFDGEVFDAHHFVSELIKSAKEEIILIDNYVTNSTLNTLSKKKKQVKVKIYTKSISKQLLQDKEKFTKQYGNLEISKFDKSHDRFLIIDSQIYHIRASLKDLGKKWFAFSRLNIESLKILKRIE